MKKAVVLLTATLALALGACTDQPNAVKVAEAHGFTDVETTGYRFFGCSEDDAVRTGFKAKGPNGEEVSGVVCQGLLVKSSTLRVD